MGRPSIHLSDIGGADVSTPEYVRTPDAGGSRTTGYRWAPARETIVDITQLGISGTGGGVGGGGGSVGGVSTVSGAGRVGRTTAGATQAPGRDDQTSIRRGEDRVEVSSMALYLGQLRTLPEIRQDLVDSVRSQIADGSYDTPERLDSALDEMIDDASQPALVKRLSR